MSVPRAERRHLQRGIIILPSAFTLASLFMGTWAIITANRGDLASAGWFIVIAAVLDMLDGRVARFTRTGSTFGAELDSIVDGISFGVAPAVIMYHLYLADSHWSWVVAYLYVTGTVVRLARFNVEQGGQAKVHFHGLPSPTAGMTLATFYPFSQTEFFSRYLADLPWPMIMTVLMMLLAALMVSHVPYPVFPKFSFRSGRGLLNLAVFLTAVAAAVVAPALSFFPVLITYIVWALFKSVLLGFVDRLPERDPLLDVDEDGADEAAAELRAIEYEELAPVRFATRPADPETTEDAP
ncbi:MAG: CDP-diacylglycerol--serine O-phosphatidyltransferase [Gemmatimonadetes bacterium]|nr:CDP-diacylglycerol--serine O-phosphatidyltransferase [Gemmatimonadota bacterium]